MAGIDGWPFDDSLFLLRDDTYEALVLFMSLFFFVGDVCLAMLLRPSLIAIVYTCPPIRTSNHLAYFFPQGIDSFLDSLVM